MNVTIVVESAFGTTATVAETGCITSRKVRAGTVSVETAALFGGTGGFGGVGVDGKDRGRATAGGTTGADNP